MERSLTSAAPRVVSAATVRDTIARAWLARDVAFRDAPRTDPRLGTLTLRPHQIDAVARLRATIAEFGGALLADEVGLGKTYVALALAREAQRPAIVAPAALRDMWRQALDVAGLRAPFISFEALSRARAGRDSKTTPTSRPPDFLVVDEAHHARTPDTRRYHALACLATTARVLLLSATPIHNRLADLTTLLALFLGARARSLDEATIARLIVRRDRAALRGRDEPPGSPPSTSHLPDVAPPVWLPLPAHDHLLDALLALPPPLPPSDGGDGGALLVHLLVRQWASSDAALAAALRRRLARGAAIAASLEQGRYPTRGELAAWTSDGESVQLAFAELLAPSPASALHCPDRGRSPDAAGLLAAVRAHDAAARALLADLRAADTRDAARATLIAELCARHADEKVVAFAAFTETVEALFRRLRGRVRVAALTTRRALVAGGPLSRREALARFAPRGSRAPPPANAERVDLLLATDLLSEGVNLQDASVVVHLDLPWTPARLEQRVGRVARLGSRHERVAVYALSPPASAEAVLRVERRLREKLRVAGRAVGVAGAILPAATAFGGAGAEEADGGAPVHSEAVRRLLAGWLDADPRRDRRVAGTEPPPWTVAGPSGAHDDGAPLVAAVRSPVAGYLALCLARAADPAHPGAATLVAALGAAPPAEAPEVVRRAVELATGAPDVPLDAAAAELAGRAVAGWAAGRSAAAMAGLSDVGVARARRRLVQRIAAVVRRTPHHRRAAVAALALDARRAALAACGAGAEWVLDELASAELVDELWLRAVAAFGAAVPSSSGLGRDDGATAELVVAALLLLVTTD